VAAEQLVLDATVPEKPWWERGVWANGMRPDISERPSLQARYRLMAQAVTTGMVRESHGPMDIAEWWMERARHAFRVALWSDDAIYGDAR
jgi:hypothetical protein